MATATSSTVYADDAATTDVATGLKNTAAAALPPAAASAAAGAGMRQSIPRTIYSGCYALV